jgi:ABC-2 type transport system ATP-binding protein
MSKIVEVSNLNKQFKGSNSKALDDINFSVSAGEFFCIIGPDAAGKTTLMRILASILSFDSGSVNILGKKIPTEIADIQGQIGYMPQKFGLYEDLSVMENLELNCDLRGVFGDARRHQIEKLLTATNLKNFPTRLAGNLSGGMKQKLALACTLVANPKVLLLDEVSVGVDPISRHELIAIIKDLAHDGTAILWSTTYLDEAEKYGDKILLINEGKQIFFGKSQDFSAKSAGRSFLISPKNKNSNRRQNLKNILQLDGVNDAFLRGEDIKILATPKSIEKLAKDYEIKPLQPSIEDSFLEILHKKLPNISKLAKRYDDENHQEKIVIEATNLTKKFGDFIATNQVNFQIKSGQIFGFLGPNGAGKSTTFKMLCGLLKPTSGSAHVSGISLLNSADEARQKIGYMAQKFSLYGELSVLQNLKFFCGAYGLNEKNAKSAIAEIVASLDLAEFLNIDAAQLPLGIKQRLALGCAVLHKPEVLFLDEPTSGVDPATRREFWFHINALASKGVTIMVTTHFMDEAEYCDIVAIIYRGKKIAEGDPQALKNSIRSAALPNPNFEDVFTHLIKKYDEEEKNS